jgi:hypothetical protein
MLVDPDECAIDEGVFEIWISGEIVDAQSA